MTVARSVADVLAEHVQFEVECIDRMYCNLCQPRLQYPAGLVGYVHRRLELPIASTAPLAKITDRFVAAVHRFAKTGHIPWVDFVKGQRKDDVMHEQLASFTAREGVVFIGRAQEKTNLFRTEKRHHADGVAAMFLTRVHDRFLPTEMADLADQHTPRPLRLAATAYQNAIDTLTTEAGLAA